MKRHLDHALVTWGHVSSCFPAEHHVGSRQTYTKDPTRVVLVVGNAPTAQPPLGHDGIQSGIRVDGVATAAARGLHEGVDGSVSSVLFLDLSVLSASVPEEEAAGYGKQGDHTDHNSCHNTTNVGRAALRRCCGCRCDDNNTGCRGYQRLYLLMRNGGGLLWPPETTVDEATTLVPLDDVTLSSAYETDNDNPVLKTDQYLLLSEKPPPTTC